MAQPGYAEFARVLGQLEGGIKSLSASMERILNWQNEFPQEMEASRRRIYERLEGHEQTQEQALSKLRKSVDNVASELQQSVSTITTSMEGIMDRVEGQGRALEDLESRVSEMEMARKLALGRDIIYRRWLKGLMASFAVLESDHLTGSRAIKWLASLIGIKL